MGVLKRSDEEDGASHSTSLNVSSMSLTHEYLIVNGHKNANDD